MPILSTFSLSQLNAKVIVAAQSLQTNHSVGFAVLDTGAEYSNEVLQALRTIEGTFRCPALLQRALLGAKRAFFTLKSLKN
jgi:hypothetical protein